MPRKRSKHPDGYLDWLPIRLRDLMKQQGKTQQEVADAIGKTRQAVGFYADGSASPDWKTVVALAEYFGVSSDHLLGLSEAPTRDENVKFVCSYTGLTDKTVETLHSFYRPYGFSPDEIILIVRIVDELLSNETREAIHEVMLRYVNCNVCWENRPATYRDADSDKALEEELTAEIFQAGEIYDAPTPDWDEYIKQVSVQISAKDAAMFYRNKAVEIVRQCAEKVFDDEAEYRAKNPIRNFRIYETPRDVAPRDDKEEAPNGEHTQD